MELTTPTPSVNTQDFNFLDGIELSAWFRAAGLPAELVSNCGDPHCRDCITIEPARAA